MWPWFSVVESKDLHCDKSLRNSWSNRSQWDAVTCSWQSLPWEGNCHSLCCKGFRLLVWRLFEISGCLRSTCSKAQAVSICCHWGHFPGNMMSLLSAYVGCYPMFCMKSGQEISVSTVAMFLLLPWRLYADATAIETVISVFPQKFLVALKCLVFNFDQWFWLWKKKERERKLTFSFFIFWVEFIWQSSLY